MKTALRIPQYHGMALLRLRIRCVNRYGIGFGEEAPRRWRRRGAFVEMDSTPDSTILWRPICNAHDFPFNVSSLVVLYSGALYASTAKIDGMCEHEEADLLLVNQHQIE